MRILHVSDSYAPVIGGLERAVRTLAQAQSRRGDAVAVVTGAHPDAPERQDDDDVQVIRTAFTTQKVPGALADAARPFHPTITDPLFSKAVARVIEEFRPDVVHCHGWSLYSALRPSRQAGIPVIMANHDYSHVCAIKTMLRDGTPCPGPALRRCVPCAAGRYGPKGIPLALGLQLSNRRHRQVTKWTGVSEAIADSGSAMSEKHGAPVTVVSSCVPDEVLELGVGRPRPSFVPQDGPYLLFVGALGPHKGLTVLLDAHELLRSRYGTQMPLVCIGTPRSDTPSMARPGVVVAHDVAHETVMAAWRHAEIGVVPSLSEAFGQVAVEALAAGTALVASRTGGLPDILTDGETGLLVPPGDPAALAAALARLCNDPQLRGNLAAAGPARARLFTVSYVAARFDELYRDAIAAQSQDV